MATTPVSYKDPLYASLDERVTQKLGLPEGLLPSIRTRGERSNADQVSEAGAKTVYQITPTTRKLVLDKYGVDAYLSADNAAEAAGLLLKESLDRNKGDTALAAAEYHGGTNRTNWGPRTKAYVSRVAGGAAAPSAARNPSAAPSGGPSIQRAYDAYRAGRMSPQDATEFEADVTSGAVDLPLGMSLKRAAPAAPGPAVPQSVIDAYTNGKMSPQDAAEFEADMRSNPGLVPEGVLKGAALIPGQAPGMAPSPDGSIPQGPQVDAGIGGTLLGTGEAALSLATGMTGGAVGMAGGAIKGIAGSILDGSFGTPEAMKAVEQAAAGGAKALTYAPRTQSGQAQTAAVGEAMGQAIPAMPLTGELAALSRAGQAMGPSASALPGMARTAAMEAIPPGARQAMQQIPGRIAQAVRREPEVAKPTPGTMGSVGAAGTDMATIRRMTADEMPVPITLTKGQATRDFDQVRFERETSKSPTQGAALRDKFEEQNGLFLKNFDAMVDLTGAEAPTLRAAGIIVDKALVAKAKRDMTEINVKYATAKRSPEAKALVDQAMDVTIGEGDSALTSTPLAYINEQPVGLPSTAVTDAARQYAVRLGVAELVDGELVPRPTATIANLEAWRKSINEATGYEPVDVRHSTILKKLIDGQTEPVAGPLYRQARSARARYAEQYENRAVINDLLSLKKGTLDRKVAFEDVFDRTILRGSLDDVRVVRKVLQTEGDAGKQAWRELQGQAVNYIKDQATRGAASDSRGNRTISVAGLKKAIQSLDADGKLDFIFGKKGGEQLRALSDLSEYVFTGPPGTVNSSNTASVLLAAMDMAISGAGGMPLPITSGLRLIVNNVKDRRVRLRVSAALAQPSAKKPTLH